MVHEGTDTTGMEEWRCPVCGRQVRWPPTTSGWCWPRENATHVGTKGDVGLGGIQVTPASGAGDDDAWRRWLRDHGIDWDGPEA